MTTLETRTGSAIRPLRVEFPEEAFVGTAAGVPTPGQREQAVERTPGRTP
jgi:hypothetical protein